MLKDEDIKQIAIDYIKKPVDERNLNGYTEEEKERIRYAVCSLERRTDEMIEQNFLERRGRF